MRAKSHDQKAVSDKVWQHREPTVFVTGPSVQSRYYKSHTTVWRWWHDEELGFPKPLKINGRNFWRLSDLEDWEATQAGKQST